MMRRRAFFGGKKEPVYLYKSGEGFIETPISGHTFGYAYSGETLGKNGIQFSTTDGVIMFAIGKKSSGRTVAFAINSEFKGYKRLFVEAAGTAFTLPLSLYFGVSSNVNAPSWIAYDSVTLGTRQIYSLDITGISEAGYLMLYVPQTAPGIANAYNIWLE